ncbi:TraM recognition domain-containing protein [Fulvivirgaceae bacterium BMA12]|uniref:TraM recognition domain-containing protein n=1 Tax=Agaribacillus aureus TaxID=3051825 RepID=A0ABT8LB88_9BACT|nr:TraM recognition domain-containing protein [Fulvivirgaceae bacterium BMA12]
MNLFKKLPSGKNDGSEDLLDQPLYKVPGTDTVITWADAVEGTLITGATGSGKSSGPGRHAALAMLKSGFGFCVLCAKPDEKDRWVKYARQAGREDDLVTFNKESGLKFNFLKYEMERSGEGAGEILNLINALMNLNEQSKVYQSGSGGNKEERFWDNSLRRLISRTIATLRLAGEEVSVKNMRKLVSECFKDKEPETYEYLYQMATTTEDIDPVKRGQASEDLNLWIKSSYFLQVILKMQDNISSESVKDEINLVRNYWLKEFPKIGEKTASIVTESFMGIVEPFMNQGILNEQFAGGLSSDLLPENIVSQNKIVIIDFPIKEFGLAGIYAATIYKTAFQAAMERRKIENETNPKPVALWIDEYQSFCNPMTDSLFQTTARSSWVATVYITQSINNIFFVMGNNQPQARAKSLLGNLNLKYFASNADIDTNYWASQMIGQHMTDIQTLNISKNMEVSKSKAQHLQFRVMPDHFTTLKTGRKANNYIVETVAFKSGKLWGKNKENYALVGFRQRR